MFKQIIRALGLVALVTLVLQVLAYYWPVTKTSLDQWVEHVNIWFSHLARWCGQAVRFVEPFFKTVREPLPLVFHGACITLLLWLVVKVAKKFG